MFSKTSKKHFGISLTINDYRHIYSTHKAEQTVDLTLKQRLKSIDETAKAMNNSFITDLSLH